ncbi:MmpS family transport accessory protein [Mycobacterium xenopi]|nr:MmpS family transport accessory protein [Mycobacterium xenopi]MDA3638958.1 MmpS family transport accessory protein [Mycobacterium xenopi]MDA3657216.1 MmpS family transport accessory protein [Mycobacterium xenopi]MDA3660958.1 MmpS family transport accessory protein [Mycobacterium xenopi]
MQRISVTRLMRRRWMVLVAAMVVGVAGFGVYRLHGIFGSHNDTSTPTGVLSESVPFNPKHVVYEVFGDPGAVATINYQDIHAAPQRVDRAPLPWKYEAVTTDPAVIANLTAQGNSSTLGCRITINDEVKDERIVNEVNAYTFCLDKSG